MIRDEIDDELETLKKIEDGAKVVKEFKEDLGKVKVRKTYSNCTVNLSGFIDPSVDCLVTEVKKGVVVIKQLDIDTVDNIIDKIYENKMF